MNSIGGNFMTGRKEQTRILALGAVFTALVIILQLMGSFIRFGPFAISLVLVPIVIGAATCGYKIGAWLGFIFGVVVLARKIQYILTA
jgi:thiamine transporter ThiT